MRSVDGSGSETVVDGDSRVISSALDKAGIEGYRFQGKSLQVRASQVEQTLATLERTEAPENKWTARWEDQVGRLGALVDTAVRLFAPECHGLSNRYRWKNR